MWISCENRASTISRFWQTAGDRVFLYLRCLNLPAAQIFEIALSALKAAENNCMNEESNDNSPVAEAMVALDKLLRKQHYEMGGGENFPDGLIRPATRDSSMPPIRRLHMTPQDLE